MLQIISFENKIQAENNNPLYVCSTDDELISSYQEIKERNWIFLNQNTYTGVNQYLREFKG